MAGWDVEIRINLEDEENLEIVVKTFEIFTYQKNISDNEKTKIIQSFKLLTGKLPALFKLPSEEFSVFELKVLGNNVHIVLDTSILDEHYFSDLFSSLLNIPKSNSLLRSLHSLTGSVLFLGKLENKLEWAELSEPLSNEVISVSGWIEYENEVLEALGATCNKEINSSVTLLVIGEESSQKAKEKATELGIKIIDENELQERIEGWHLNITRSKEHEEWINNQLKNEGDNLSEIQTNKPTLIKLLVSMPFFLIGASLLGGAVWLVIVRIIEGFQAKPDDGFVIGWLVVLVLLGLSFLNFGKNALFEGLVKESKSLIGPVIYYIFGVLVSIVGLWSFLAGSQQAIIVAVVGVASIVYGFKLSTRNKKEALWSTSTPDEKLDTVYTELETLQKNLKNPLWRAFFRMRSIINIKST